MNSYLLLNRKLPNRRQVLRVSVYLFLLVLLSACSLSSCLGPSIDKAIKILDEASTRMGDANDNWQLILQETRDKLIKEGFAEVGNQVKQIIDRTAGNTLIVTLCIEDNFRQRLRQELMNIKAQLQGKPVVEHLKPVICKASAKGNPYIDLSNYPNAIELVGYDMGTNLKVALIEKNGTRDITSSYDSGLYEATVTLGANGPALSDNSQKVVFYWKNNNEELKAVGITRTKPPDCEIKENFPPYTPFRPPKPLEFYPPLVKGDADFHSHGPIIHAEVQLVNLGNGVIAHVSMNARETETNGTTGDGSFSYPIYTPPGGYQVLRINADVKAIFDYRDTNHEKDEVPGKGGDFYKRVTFIGDTGDDDVCSQMNCGGYQTSLVMDFNQIQFSLIQVENCTPRVNNPPSEIDKKYATMQNRLGRALGPELYTADRTGRMRRFEGGWIYWTPASGVHVIWGSIYDKWASLGYEASFLGYPTTDEMTTPDGKGRYNHFQGGSIYWTPWTGANEIHGGIREKWASMGWERSSLGYPISDELYGNRWVGGWDGNWSRISLFEHGWIEGRWAEGIFWGLK